MKIRNGVTIKLRKDVHRDIVKLQAELYDKLGKKPTISDVIEALIKTKKGAEKAIGEYLRRKVER